MYSITSEFKLWHNQKQTPTEILPLVCSYSDKAPSQLQVSRSLSKRRLSTWRQVQRQRHVAGQLTSLDSVETLTVALVYDSLTAPRVTVTDKLLLLFFFYPSDKKYPKVEQKIKDIV